MSDNFIWTKHVKERSQQRGIGEDKVWSTLRYPQQTEKRSDGSFRFYKNFGGQLVCIVARPEGSQWLILTTFTKKSHSKAYQQYSTPRQGPLIQRLVFKLIVWFGQFLRRLSKKH